MAILPQHSICKKLTELDIPLDIIYVECYCNELTTLKLHKKLKRIDCSNNKLTELELNDSLEYLSCYSNQLTLLKCNKHLNYLNCSDNKLIKLELNDGLEQLICFDNKLTTLKCNKNLKYLICSNNILTELELNDGLETLGCSGNKLTSIKYIPSTLTRIECNGTNFDYDTKLRIVKHCLEYTMRYIEYEFREEIKNYKKYLVLLLQLNTYIIKYL